MCNDADQWVRDADTIALAVLHRRDIGKGVRRSCAVKLGEIIEEELPDADLQVDNANGGLFVGESRLRA